MKSDGKKDENKTKFCTKAFLLTNLQSVTKIMLFTKFNKVYNLSRYYIFYWDCLMYHISARIAQCIVTFFMK